MDELQELPLVQVFSADDDAVSFGRDLAPAHGWIEIMRSDARPYFEEAMRPPACPDWSPGEPTGDGSCVHMDRYGSGRWNDAPCEDPGASFGMVCERSMVP